MPISGLVLTLAPGASASRVRSHLRGDPRIDVGERTGRRLPIVTETASAREDRELWTWLESHDGIAHVDVAFIQFDEIPPKRTTRAEERAREVLDR